MHRGFGRKAPRSGAKHGWPIMLFVRCESSRCIQLELDGPSQRWIAAVVVTTTERFDEITGLGRPGHTSEVKTGLSHQDASAPGPGVILAAS
jgi:hypothetical protein